MVPNRANDSAQVLVARVGAHLREARLRRGLTLERVATAAGLTKGFLSQFERGGSSASIASLLALCSALDIDIASVLGHVSRAAATASVVRREDRETMYLFGDGVTDYLISPPLDRRLEVFETHLEPRGTAGEEPYSVNADVGFVCVLRGRLQFRAGAVTHSLRAGDTLIYSPREPHTFSNPSGKRRAVVLFLTTPAVFLSGP